MGISSKAKSAVKSVTSAVGGAVTSVASAVGGVVSSGAKAVGGAVVSVAKAVTPAISSSVKPVSSSGTTRSSGGGGGGGQTSPFAPAGTAVGSAIGGGVIRSDGQGGSYVDRTTTPSEAITETTGRGTGGRGGGGSSDVGTPIQSLATGGVKTDTGKVISQQEAQNILTNKKIENQLTNYAQIKQQFYQQQLNNAINRISNFSSLPTSQQQKIIDNELKKTNQRYDTDVRQHYENLLTSSYPGSTIAPMSTPKGVVYNITPSEKMTNLLISNKNVAVGSYVNPERSTFLERVKQGDILPSAVRRTFDKYFAYPSEGVSTTYKDAIEGNRVVQTFTDKKTGKIVSYINANRNVYSVEGKLLGPWDIDIAKAAVVVAGAGALAFVEPLTGTSILFSKQYSSAATSMLDKLVPEKQGVVSQLIGGTSSGASILVPGLGVAYGTELVKGLVMRPGETAGGIYKQAIARPFEFGSMLIAGGLSGKAVIQLKKLSPNYIPVRKDVLPDGKPYKYTEVLTSDGTKIKLRLQEPGVLPKVDVLKQLEQNLEVKGERFYIHTSPELIRTAGGKLVVNIDRGLYTAPENILKYKYDPSVLKTASELGIQSPTQARIPKLNTQQKAILEVVIKRGDIVGGGFAQKTLFPNARKFGDIDIISRDPHNTAIDIANRLGPQHRVMKGIEGKFSVVNTRTGKTIVDIASTILYRTNLLGDVGHIKVGGLKVLDPYALRDIKVKTIQRAPIESKIKAAKDIEFLTGAKAKQILRPTQEVVPQSLLYYSGVGGERMGLMRFLVRKARGEDVSAKFTFGEGRAGIQVIAEKAPKYPKWLMNVYKKKLITSDLKIIDYYAKRFDKTDLGKTNVESIITGGGRKGLTASAKEIKIGKAMIQYSRETKQALVMGPEFQKLPYGPELQMVESFGKEFQKVSPSFREKAYKLFGMERGRKFTLVGGQPVEISFFEPVKTPRAILEKVKVSQSEALTNKYISNRVREVSSQVTRDVSGLGRREVIVKIPRPIFPAKSEFRKQQAESPRIERDNFSLTRQRFDFRNIRVRDFEARGPRVSPRTTQPRIRPPEMRVRGSEFRLTPEVPRIPPTRIRPPRLRTPPIKTRLRVPPIREPPFRLTPSKQQMRRPRGKIVYAKSKTRIKGRRYILQPTIAGVSFGLIPRRRKRLSQMTGWEILR